MAKEIKICKICKKDYEGKPSEAVSKKDGVKHEMCGKCFKLLEDIKNQNDKGRGIGILDAKPTIDWFDYSEGGKQQLETFREQTDGGNHDDYSEESVP